MLVTSEWRTMTTFSSCSFSTLRIGHTVLLICLIFSVQLWKDSWMLCYKLHLQHFSLCIVGSVVCNYQIPVQGGLCGLSKITFFSSVFCISEWTKWLNVWRFVISYYIERKFNKETRMFVCTIHKWASHLSSLIKMLADWLYWIKSNF